MRIGLLTPAAYPCGGRVSQAQAMDQETASFDDLLETMKHCSAWLREADVDFVLAGSVAAWARGGPAVCSDLDFVVRPADSERALEVLGAHGLRTERPPEGWLVKAYDGDILVDLIHDPNGLDVEETFARADTLSVMSVDMHVMAVDDVVVTKLEAFEEHYIDFVGVLSVVRALREQIDWPQVRRRLADNPFAIGFFAMAEALGVAPGQRAALRRVDEPRIRVTTT